MIEPLESPGGGGKHLTAEQARNLRDLLRGLRHVDGDETKLWAKFYRRALLDAAGVISKDAGIRLSVREGVRQDALSWFRNGSAKWFLMWLGADAHRAQEVVDEDLRILAIGDPEQLRAEILRRVADIEAVLNDRRWAEGEG